MKKYTLFNVLIGLALAISTGLVGGFGSYEVLTSTNFYVAEGEIRVTPALLVDLSEAGVTTTPVAAGNGDLLVEYQFLGPPEAEAFELLGVTPELSRWKYWETVGWGILLVTIALTCVVAGISTALTKEGPDQLYSGLGDTE